MLREEDGRLERIMADLTLERKILRKIVSKKLLSLVIGVGWRGGCGRRIEYRKGIWREFGAWHGAPCAIRAEVSCGRRSAVDRASWRQLMCVMDIAA